MNIEVSREKVLEAIALTNAAREKATPIVEINSSELVSDNFFLSTFLSTFRTNMEPWIRK